MTGQRGLSRYRMAALSCVLILLMAGMQWVGLVPAAIASVGLLYFQATPSGNAIKLEWETATEQNTVAFNLFRHEASNTTDVLLGTFTCQEPEGCSVGAEYSYLDTAVVAGVRYYYSLEEIDSFGARTIIAQANAGIDVPTLTPTPTASATATATATVASGVAATHTPTATGLAGRVVGDQPTATRQFTNTPPPATAAPGSTPTSPAVALATVAPIGSGVVSSPTVGPSSPNVPAGVAESTAVATPFPPAEPTASLTLLPSPSPEIFATSAVRPALGLTPEATRPPQVFAAATSRSQPGSSVRPTPVPAAEAKRNTNSTLLLGGGVILLAAVLGGGILLLMRSWRTPS